MTFPPAVPSTQQVKFSKNHTPALILRVLLGAWFTYAGCLKVFVTGLGPFALDIANYKLLPTPLILLTAYLIPWAEIIAGTCFMLGILRKGAWFAMLGLVLAFTLSVGSAWARGLDISCGCLGSSEKISYWRKAIEFSLYLLTLAYLATHDLRPTPTPIE